MSRVGLPVFALLSMLFVIPSASATPIFGASVRHQSDTSLLEPVRRGHGGHGHRGGHHGHHGHHGGHYGHHGGHHGHYGYWGHGHHRYSYWGYPGIVLRFGHW